jgi:excisionase family DNA binding protein
MRMVTFGRFTAPAFGGRPRRLVGSFIPIAPNAFCTRKHVQKILVKPGQDGLAIIARGFPCITISCATENDMSEDKRLTLTVPEAAERLGISRNAAYEAAQRGEIPSIRVGKRLLVPRAAFEKLLAGEAA